jgi:tellurite resistance protein TerC
MAPAVWPRTVAVMDVPTVAWAGLAVAVVGLLAIDLFGFALKDEDIGLRQAAVASALWTALGLGFATIVWAAWGSRYAGEYLTGFLLEKSLSVDNLFVFALIFGYFGIGSGYQRRVMFWGIVGAVVLRGIFIAAGAALLDAFHFAIYVFAAFLIVVGVRMATHEPDAVDLGRNRVLRLMSKVIPIEHDHQGHALFVRRGGRRVATPLFGALVMVAFFDAVFALDSIPAIFGVTREVFLVAAANAFSLLGLAALYFTLAAMLERFRYMSGGIAAVLVLVGVKMLIGDFVDVPAYVALGVVAAVLGIAVGASLRTERRQRALV